jgi:hypothetical protein
VFAAGHEVAKPTPAFSPLSQTFASVASNGETFATTWFTEGKVYGALFDAAGQRITAGDLTSRARSNVASRLP